MEYKLEKNSDGLCRIFCTFSASEVLAEWKKAASRFAPAVRMAGFRPGHAPLEVLDRQFGRQIAEETTDVLVGRAVDTVLNREQLHPSAGFDYEGDTAGRGRDFSFTVSFSILPETPLPDLEALRMTETPPSADPVQESLFVREILGRIAAKTTVTEGFPQNGDIVEAEVTGKVDGHTVPGMNTGPCRMRLMPARPGERVPDLDPIIRGLKVGEIGTGFTPCPDNYPDPSMRGRSIELIVKLRSIERETLPPLTDETARSLGFSGVAALKASAHARALEMDRVHRHAEARRALRNRLENWEGFEAPEALVHHCQHDVMRRSRQYLQNRFDSPEKLKETLAVMRDESARTARGKARGRALLLGWARVRGLSVDDGELKRVLAGRAARRNMDVESYMRSLARSGEIFELRAAMLEERALDALMNKVFRP